MHATEFQLLIEVRQGQLQLHRELRELRELLSPAPQHQPSRKQLELPVEAAQEAASAEAPQQRAAATPQFLRDAYTELWMQATAEGAAETIHVNTTYRLWCERQGACVPTAHRLWDWRQDLARNGVLQQVEPATSSDWAWRATLRRGPNAPA